LPARLPIRVCTLAAVLLSHWLARCPARAPELLRRAARWILARPEGIAARCCVAGVARGRGSRQVTPFLLLAYFAEGIVRALTESGARGEVARGWPLTSAAAVFAALLLSLRSRRS
jgi:uncharacterized membrane protein